MPLKRLTRSRKRFSGTVEHVRGRVVMGWAIDLDDPSKPVEIEAVENGSAVARATANSFRPDLRSGLGTGWHGFELPIDLSRATSRTVTIRIVGTRQKLRYQGNAEVTINAGAFGCAGAIDAVHDRTIYGWAAEFGARRPVDVEAVYQGKVIARATANQMREDVRAAGFGTGHHGFALAIPPAPTQRVQVRVVGADSWLSHLEDDFIEVPGVPRCVGLVESVDGSIIRGWAADAHHVATSIEVEALIADHVVARTVTARPRADLEAHGINPGDHGFELSLEVPRGESRIANVRIAGTKTDLLLDGSPDITVHGPPRFYKGRIDGTSGHVVEGWALNEKDPSEPVTVEAVVAGRPVATARADLPRKDLTVWGHSDGNHGFELPVDTPSSAACAVRVRIAGTDEYLTQDGKACVLVRPQSASVPANESHQQAEAQEKYAFYDSVVAPIRGWLERGAAIRTMDVLEFQDNLGLGGGFLEIGVFCGKYFSILARYARRSSAALVGIDPFIYEPEAAVWQAVDPVLGDHKPMVKLLTRFSRQCDVPFLLTELGGEKARFISIDGSHECEDVLHDLELCEQLLAVHGVIALDDFVNPVALGVNEAANRFFFEPRSVVPWCFVENKLFLSHRDWAPVYRDMLEETLQVDRVERHAKRYRDYANQREKHLIETKMWGSTFTLLP